MIVRGESGRKVTYSTLTASEFGIAKRGSASQSRVLSVPLAVAFVMIWKKRRKKLDIHAIKNQNKLT
jgi:uncharacterized membrane-anchored protein